MDLIAGTGLVILLKFDSNLRFFGPCDLENWWMTSKNSRAPLLYYVKLCAKFQSHRWIQTRAKVRKRSIQVKIGAFFRVTLTFDEWPSKSKGHLFCTSLSFVYHFVAIGEFKLELTETLNSGQTWWFFFLPRVTLKFDGRPWKIIGHLSCAASSVVHHFIVICEFKLELQSRNLGFGLCVLHPWSLTLTFCMDVTSVNGNNSWKFRDDTMMET